MSRNHRIEVERQNSIECFRPLQKTTSLRVIHIDVRTAPSALSQKQVARVNDSQRRKVHNSITAGVSATEILRPDFPAGKVNGKLVRKSNPWQADRRAGCVFVVRLFDVG